MCNLNFCSLSVQQNTAKKFLFLFFLIFTFFILNNFISIFYQQSQLKLLITHQHKNNISQLILFQNQLKSLLKNYQKNIKYKHHYTNLAIELHQNRKLYNYSLPGEFSKVTHCETVQLSSPFQLLHNNFYWQVLRLASGEHENDQDSQSIYLQNAYYDDRRAAKPVVVILAVSKQQLTVAQKKFGCFLWFDNFPHPVLSVVSSVYPNRHKLERNYSGIGVLFFICEIPAVLSSQQRVPKAVSLLQLTAANKDGKSCDSFTQQQPTNVLRVLKYDKKFRSKKDHHHQLNRTLHSSVHNSTRKHQQRSIGVCVQALRFANIEYSARMVEWLEMLRVLGADQVYLYLHDASRSLKRVLWHYQQEGFVQLRFATLPEHQLNVRSLYNYFHSKKHLEFWIQEHVELNDCLYQNLHRHEFIAIIDVDELILPKTTLTWHKLLDSLEKSLTSAVFDKIAYFKNKHVQVSSIKKFDQNSIINSVGEVEPIPWYMYMTQHIFFNSPMLINFKSFHRTKHIFSINNHMSIKCLPLQQQQNSHQTLTNCQNQVINSKQSILAHYRNKQQFKCLAAKKCVTTKNKTIWKYYNTTKENIKQQLKKIFA